MNRIRVVTGAIVLFIAACGAPKAKDSPTSKNEALRTSSDADKAQSQDTEANSDPPPPSSPTAAGIDQDRRCLVVMTTCDEQLSCETAKQRGKQWFLERNDTEVTLIQRCEGSKCSDLWLFPVPSGCSPGQPKYHHAQCLGLGANCKES